MLICLLEAVPQLEQNKINYPVGTTLDTALKCLEGLERAIQRAGQDVGTASE